MAGFLRPGRFPRRRGLITLSLSSRENPPVASAFSPAPEITETEVWLSRLSPAHDGLKIVQLTDLHHSLFYSPGRNPARRPHGQSFAAGFGCADRRLRYAFGCLHLAGSEGPWETARPFGSVRCFGQPRFSGGPGGDYTRASRPTHPSASKLPLRFAGSFRQTVGRRGGRSLVGSGRFSRRHAFRPCARP